MDHWLQSPLNKAHYYDRKANALVKKLCFDEAIECHIFAAKYLTESYTVTDNEKAKECIQLQKEYHLKQREFLRLKKLQYQAFKEVARVKKEAMSRMLKARESNEHHSGSENENSSLQKDIYRTIEEADSLLEVLFHKNDEHYDNLEGKDSGGKATVKGTALPKDDKTVIEELRIVNYQLRTLVSELMTQLSKREKEVAALKQRVAELEAENRRLEPDFVNASNYSSPFVFSPEDELTPSAAPELPALAPLEMPNFDFSVLHKKYPTKNQS